MFERINVRNYRGFDDVSVGDLGRINLVAGRNNAGKTTLLEAIRLLCGAADPRMAANSNVARLARAPSLCNAGLPVPARPGEPIGATPAVNVLILPGNGAPGMLETLLCRTFAGTAADRCIDDFFRGRPRP